ncbi:hypothetical protein NHQ30_000341 [Ciborinia camelliae]|nr:hypothetical protein NHQ30_000341 [Ciborinia camelliae]
MASKNCLVDDIGFDNYSLPVGPRMSFDNKPARKPWNVLTTILAATTTIFGTTTILLEVMHSLHRLADFLIPWQEPMLILYQNAIPKALSPKYYADHDMHGNLPEQLVHIDHCINQIRQSIQYAGDLTPVPLRPYGEDPSMTLIGTPQIHTRRNWERTQNSKLVYKKRWISGIY